MCAAFAIVLSSLSYVTVNAQDDEELVLRVAMQDDIRTTNPLNARDVWSWDVLKWLYDSPINPHFETSDIFPYIAVGSANQSAELSTTNWDDCTIGIFGYNPEGTWVDQNKSEATIFYDFTGVKWHDDEQMTIRDVLFSYHVTAQMPDWASDVNCLKDKGGRAGSNYPNDHKLHIELVYEDSTTNRAALRFTLQEPFALFFSNTLPVLLLPYHIWGTTESGQFTDNTLIWVDTNYTIDSLNAWSPEKATAWDNPNPVGSGPFTWDYWNPAMGVSKIKTWRGFFYKEGWNLEYDPDGLSGQPVIDAILFMVYKTAETAVLALKNDDIDYIGWPISPSNIGLLAYYPGIAVQQSMDTGFYYLGYNMRKKSFGYNETGYDHGKPLRHAIAHCIDKPAIVKRLLLSFGLAGVGPVSSLSEWYNVSIPKYEFNPAKAFEILENAGYQLTDGNGSIPGEGNWWLNPDGSQLGDGVGGRIEILTPQSEYDTIRAQCGIMMASQLRKVGINAVSRPIDFSQIIDMIGAGRDASDYEIYIFGWRIKVNNPTDYLHSFFHSSNAYAGYNFVGYQNSSFDAVIDQARMTDDNEERKRLIFEAQAAISYDLPYDVLYYRTLIELYRSDGFIGWQAGSSGSIYNWGSIFNLRKPSGYRLNAKFVNLPLSSISNTSIPIEILVTDQDRIPIEGAQVLLNVSDGKLGNNTLKTTSSGKTTTTYTAPYVPPTIDNIENGSTVVIYISEASYSVNDIEYTPPPSRMGIITIYPEETQSMHIKINVNPDVIDPDIDVGGVLGFTYLDVKVKYQDDYPAQDVVVEIEVTPSSIILEQELVTTDTDGKASIKLTAVDLENNDGSTEEYTIVASAYHPTNTEIKKGTSNVYVYVVDDDPPEEYLSFDWKLPITFGFGILIMAVTASIIYFRRTK